jgi:hypothetical protein
MRLLPMKTDVSPMFLTYFMVKWSEVKESDTDQKCTECGRTLKKTEIFTDKSGVDYEGYVCHSDRHITWLRAGGPRPVSGT